MCIVLGTYYLENAKGSRKSSLSLEAALPTRDPFALKLINGWFN